MKRLALVSTIVFLITAVAYGDAVISEIENQKKIPAGDIIGAIKNNNSVEYDSVAIIGDLDLFQLGTSDADVFTSDSTHDIIYVNSPIKITNSEIRGPFRAENINFNESLDFSGTKFLDDANFTLAKFDGDANFHAAQFLKGFEFGLVEFNKNSQFEDAKFICNANFMMAKFSCDANFHNATFDKDARFYLSNFYNNSIFSDTLFFGDTNFDEVSFNGDAYFLGSTFNGKANFRNSIFVEKAIFSNVYFNTDVIFEGSRFLGMSDFSEDRFNGIADFSNTQFVANSYFRGDRFNEDVIFWNASFEENLFMNGTKFDRIIVQWSDIEDNLCFAPSIYLVLIKNFKDFGQYEDSANCYYQYRRFEQKRKQFGWSKLKDVLSWIFWGYGVRPTRTVFTGTLLVFFFGCVFWLGDGVQKPTYPYKTVYDPKYDKWKKRLKDARDAFYLSLLVFTFQARGDLRPRRSYRYVAVLEGILGILVFAMLIATLNM